MGELTDRANNIYFADDPRADEVGRLMQIQYNRAREEGWDFDTFYNYIVDNPKGNYQTISTEKLMEMANAVNKARAKGLVKDSWDSGVYGYSADPELDNGSEVWARPNWYRNYIFPYQYYDEEKNIRYKVPWPVERYR